VSISFCFFCHRTFLRIERVLIGNTWNQCGTRFWRFRLDIEARVARWFFHTKKSQFVWTLEGLAMENVGIFYVHLVNFPAIWYTLCPVGIFSHVWYIFTRFGMLYQDQSGSRDWSRCSLVALRNDIDFESPEASRVTRWFCEKVAQNLAQTILSQLTYNIFPMKK
jgi:hypothetical protein